MFFLHRSRAVLAAALVVVVAAAVASSPAAVAEGPSAPDREVLGPGVEYRRVGGEDLTAHVAVLEPDAPYRLRTVVAGERVGGGLERTSAMCRRVGCLVAVNGDFRLPGTRVPVGGVVRDGVLLKSPNARHHQLLVGRDGALAAGPVSLSGKVVPTDLEELALDAVNSERRDDQLVLYTSAFGPSTGTNEHGVEVDLRFVDPEGPLALGQTVVAELGEFREGGGDRPIAERAAVLSGHGEGARALRDLRERVAAGDAGRRVLLRVEAEPDAYQSVGGTPILLRDGKRWFGDAATGFVRGRHPRTVVGWNEEGRVWLVAVDGRQPDHSRGMSLAEAADLLLELGATDAVNLDGGGTTTFAVDGEVVNRPSDRMVERDGSEMLVTAPVEGDEVVGPVERPATSALALVPEDAAEEAPADPIESGSLEIPVDLPPPTVADPASVPGSDLPAIVGTAPPPRLDPTPVAVAVGVLSAVAIAMAVLRPGHRMWWRRRRLGADPP